MNTDTLADFDPESIIAAIWPLLTFLDDRATSGRADSEILTPVASAYGMDEDDDEIAHVELYVGASRH